MNRPVIEFEESVSVQFFSSVLKAAENHNPFRVTNRKLSIEDMELIRRAAAVIEAVVTGKFANEEKL